MTSANHTRYCMYVFVYEFLKKSYEMYVCTEFFISCGMFLSGCSMPRGPPTTTSLRDCGDPLYTGIHLCMYVLCTVYMKVCVYERILGYQVHRISIEIKVLLLLYLVSLCTVCMYYVCICKYHHLATLLGVLE